jgi:hypothetical protein
VSLRINSFGSRLSFELLRDDVTVGGLAYIKTGSALAASASARAHVHGEDIRITMTRDPSKPGMVGFSISKKDIDIGVMDFNWRGRGRLELARRSGGRDHFSIHPKGVTQWWFLITDSADRAVMELRPTTRWSMQDYHFDIVSRSQKWPDPVMDELAIYAGFAANVYMARNAGVVAGRKM